MLCLCLCPISLARQGEDIFFHNLEIKLNHFEKGHNKGCLTFVEVDFRAFEIPKIIHFKQVGLKNLHMRVYCLIILRIFPKLVISLPTLSIGHNAFVRCILKSSNVVMIFLIHLLLYRIIETHIKLNVVPWRYNNRIVRTISICWFING